MTTSEYEQVMRQLEVDRNAYYVVGVAVIVLTILARCVGLI